MKKRQFRALALLVIAVLAIACTSCASSPDIGNTNANVVNGGFVAGGEGCVYAAVARQSGSGSALAPSGSGLLKVSTSSQIVQTLIFEDANVSGLNFREGWFYYIASDLSGEGASLVKLSENAGDRRVLAMYSEGECSCLHVVEGWLYYAISGPAGGIYTVRADGERSMPLLREEGIGYACLNVDAGWLYYLRRNGGYASICRTQTGTMLTQTLLAEVPDSFSSMVVDSGWIYYANGSGVSRMKTDGSSGSLLASGREVAGSYLTVDGNRVYGSGPSGLFRMNVTGSGFSVYSGVGDFGPIASTGGWLYFANGMYKARRDGSSYSPMIPEDTVTDITEMLPDIPDTQNMIYCLGKYAFSDAKFGEVTYGPETARSLFGKEPEDVYVEITSLSEAYVCMAGEPVRVGIVGVFGGEVIFDANGERVFGKVDENSLKITVKEQLTITFKK